MIKGEDIKTAIRQAGITLEDAATMLDMSRQTLYNNLNRAMITPAFRKKVVEAFKPYFDVNNMTITKVKLTATNDFYENALVREPDTPYLKDMQSYVDEIMHLKRIVALQDFQIKRLEQDLEMYRTNKVNSKSA